MKQFEIAQIGDVTSNGNRIIKLQNKLEVKTPLGIMRSSETFYVAVKAESVAVEVGQQIELNPADFTVTERPFVNPDGEEMMLKWLSLTK